MARFFNRSEVNFAAMRPDGRLASTGVCLANVGVEYVVYTPPTRVFTVDLAAAKDTSLRVRWYDPHTGQFHGTAEIAGGKEAQLFTPPWTGDAVLHLLAKDRSRP